MMMKVQLKTKLSLHLRVEENSISNKRNQKMNKLLTKGISVALCQVKTKKRRMKIGQWKKREEKDRRREGNKNNTMLITMTTSASGRISKLKRTIWILTR